jgi:hypothetical protein
VYCSRESSRIGRPRVARHGQRQSVNSIIIFIFARRSVLTPRLCLSLSLPVISALTLAWNYRVKHWSDGAGRVDIGTEKQRSLLWNYPPRWS